MYRWIPLLDQATIASLSLVPSIFAARSLGVNDFGWFAGMLAIHAVLLGLSRSVSSEYLLLRQSTSSKVSTIRTSAWTRCLTLALFGSSCVAAFAATFIEPWLIALQPLLMCAFVHDFMRYTLITLDRWLAAFLLDLCYLTIVATGSALAMIFAPKAAVFVAVSGLAAFIAVLCGLILGARLPSLELSRQPWRDGEVARYGLDYGIGAASIQISLWTAVLVVGPGAAAALRGADLLLGPLRVVQQAAVTASTSVIVRRTEASQPTRRLRFRCVAGIWVCTATLMVSLQVESWALGRVLLGDTWAVVQPIAHYYFVGFLAVAVTAVTTISLKARGGGSTLLTVRLLSAGFGSIGGALAALMAGVTGVAAMALVTSVVAAVLWVAADRRVAGRRSA